ncbi:MAG: universal stress protein [Thermoanaerobaculales bacterium]|jgi:nucleotide-binding universal stress UspA family protein|nr:universal stress protein [Thermoanaerobaculales bacterium]
MSALPKTVLAATDFSEPAEAAARLARELAGSFAARFHMLHVIVLLEDPHLEESHRRQLDELVATADEARRKVLAEKPPDSAEVAVVPHLVRGIAPGETIVEVAANVGADLIVVGTHGRRGLSHLLLGSVAERVVRTAGRSVLTVRGDAAVIPQWPRRILVPHDFSDASAEAVRTAALWARHFGSEITLLHAVEPVVYPEFYAIETISDDLMGRLKGRSREALEKAAAELVGGGLPVTTRVEIGRAAETIAEVADPERYDLLVMATRGLSALEHLFLGSVTEAVLRRSRVPMLTIPNA